MQSEHVVSVVSVLMSAVQAGLQLDTAIHNSMLRAAAARGADASSLQSSIDGMVQSGVHPDQHTFTIMLRAHKQRGNAQAAAAVMAQLLDSGEAAISSSRCCMCVTLPSCRVINPRA